MCSSCFKILRINFKITRKTQEIAFQGFPITKFSRGSIPPDPPRYLAPSARDCPPPNFNALAPPLTKPDHCCDQCGKEFTRSYDLRRHVRRAHTGEQPHVCSSCIKGFATVDKLRRHEKVHQEKAFECQRCRKKFSRKVWYLVIVLL